MLSNFDSAERDYLNNIPETELDGHHEICAICMTIFCTDDCEDENHEYCDDCYEAMKESEEEDEV